MRMIKLAMLGLALFASGSSVAAAPIYKCVDAHLGLLYTDEPCDGEAMNIRSGRPSAACVRRAGLR
jgi:hypothetical protein